MSLIFCFFKTSYFFIQRKSKGVIGCFLYLLVCIFVCDIIVHKRIDRIYSEIFV